MKEFGKAYVDLWKKTFDYKSRCSIGEYLSVTIFYCVICLLFAATTVLTFLTDGETLFVKILAIIFGVFLVISLIPWTALNVRRLGTIGKSKWWALLLLVIGVGTALLIFICLAGSAAFSPIINRPVCLYGPPPIEVYDPENNRNEPVYGPPEMDEYDPEENRNECVYGPPEMDPEDPVNGTGEDQDEKPFKPELNENEEVYGPPEWFE